MNRLEQTFDAVLQLLDRQLIDAAGHFLGKVDDVELTETQDGLVITGLLTGTPALLRRLGGGLGRRMVDTHVRLRISHADRADPWRVAIEEVEYVDNAVHLTRRREGLLREKSAGRRLGSLTGMRVIDRSGDPAGRVIGARFEPRESGALALCSVLVGRGGPGSLLGYDRHAEQGPRIVAAVVRRWHRNTRVVDVEAVEIRWDEERVVLREPLKEAGRLTIET